MANIKNLKPFKKGHDPRRNLKGRPPANSEELNKLLDEIFAEEIKDGTINTNKLRVALNRLLLHKNPMGVIHVLERRYGKVPQVIKGEGENGEIKIVVEYANGNPTDTS